MMEWTKNQRMKPKLDYIIIFLVLIMFICVWGIVEVARADEINWDRLVNAVIQVESGYNPVVKSSKGATGWMQITPIVLKEYCQEYTKKQLERYKYDKPQDANFVWTMDEILDPVKNRIVGIWYLKRLRDYYLKGVFSSMCAEWNNNRKDYTTWCIDCVYGPYIKYGDYNCENLEDYKLALILAAYNGGISRLKSVNYDINKMPSETRVFLRKVLKQYKESK